MNKINIYDKNLKSTIYKLENNVTSQMTKKERKIYTQLTDFDQAEQ